VSSEEQGPQDEIPARSAPLRRQSVGWAIPIVVVLVVAGLILGLLLSAGSGQREAEQEAGPVATALPLPTHAIPYPDVPRLSAKETQARLARGEAVLIDVRSKAAYDRLHAAGALSFPESEIEGRQSELPKGTQLILYCT